MAGKSNSSLRDRLQIVPGQHRPKTIRNGTIFVIVIALFLYTIYTRPSVPLLSGGGQNVTADVTYGANLRPGYTPVRVKGIEVGQITKVKRPPSGRGVRFTMNIKAKGVHLKKDMSLSLRWKTLLGRNMYVDLHPGSPSAPKWDGGVLPTSRTSDQVELDTALEPLEQSGRTSLQTLITSANGSIKNPKTLQRTIDSVSPTMRPLAHALEALRGTEPGKDLPFLIQRTDKTVAALDQDEGALGRVLTSGETTLAATAANRANLAATVNTAPGALRDARTTLAGLDKTLDIVDPLAKHLRPGARKLDGAATKATTALKLATPLLKDLRPTFRDLQPAVSDLGKASTAGVPAFKPLGETMQRVNDDFIPFLNAKNGQNGRPNYQNLGPAVASADTALSWGDIKGPVGNFEAAAGQGSLIDNPCETKLDHPTDNQLITCNTLTKVYLAGLLGTSPTQVNMKSSSIPESRINKMFDGNKLLLKPHPTTAADRVKLKKDH